MSTRRSTILEHESEGAAASAAKRGVASLTAQPRYLVPANDGENALPALAVLEPITISVRRIARLFG